MSKIYKFPDQDRISDEASLWLARLDRGLTAQEHKDLQSWMVNDKRHRTTLFRMAELWDKMDTLSRLSDLFPPVAPKQRFAFAHATGLVLILAGFIFSWILLQPVVGVGALEQNVLVGTGVYETAIGESSLVELPDKSKVMLNTSTLVHTRYSDEQRYIVLERGEAHFTVARDVERPFVVSAGGQIIQAVGTAFNVKLRDDNLVALVVTEGRVAIGETAESSNPFSKLDRKEGVTVRLSQSTPILSEGEAAILDAEEIQIEKIKPEQLASSLSWQDGNIVFEGETLEEAIREISRYTTVKFEIVDEQIKTVRIAGMFKSGDINGLLMTLYENFSISSQQVNNEHILLGVNRESGSALPNPKM